MSGHRLLVLCGESGEVHVKEFDSVVVWSPVRRESLERTGRGAHRTFGDFTPDEATAAAMHQQLVIDLEACLLLEHRTAPELAWAPLAVQQLQWRLSRYRWVRESFKRMCDHYGPSAVTLSSAKDGEIVAAARLVCGERSIVLDVLDGDLDDVCSITYLSAPHDLPRPMDPAWLWRLRLLFFQKADVWYQPYWYPLDVFGPGAYRITMNRLLDVGRGALKKLRKLYSSTSKDMVVFESRVAVKRRYPITKHVWGPFRADERAIVQQQIDSFFNHYPPEFIAQAAARLDSFLAKGHPGTIALVHDKLPAGRLLAFLGRKRGIQVDFLNPGVLIERDTAPASGSPFVPTRYVAWNASSAAGYASLRHATAIVRHPRNDMAARELRPLSKQWNSVRVLILSSESVGISVGSRQDCMVFDLVEILSTLTALGFRSQNVSVKLARTNAFVRERELKNLAEVRKVTGVDFTLVDPARDTLTLMESYDLVLLFPTSGVCEAAFAGIPMVIFGQTIRVMGVFDDVTLPFAKTRAELAHVLQNYDSEAVRAAYQALTSSLREGPTVRELYSHHGRIASTSTDPSAAHL